MRRLFIFTISFFATSLAVPLLAFSQDQTSESSQYRLQQIENKTATKSATKVTTTNYSITFAEGVIVSATSSTILIDTADGTKTVYSADSTKYLNFDSSGKKLIGIGDLKTGDKVYVIGLPHGANLGTAKMIVRDQTKAVKNFSYFGKVTEITSASLKIGSLTRSDVPTISTTLTIETVFSNFRNQSLKVSEILVNDKIALSGYIDGKNNLIAKSIFKISTTVSKTATPSAN